MKIYVAAPFFNEWERCCMIKTVEKLRELGHEVYAPAEHEVMNAWDKPNRIWAREVFEADVTAINGCDKVVAIYDGLYSDSGTAWEIGYAYAMGKQVEILLTNKAAKSSLMIVNGCDKVMGFPGKNLFEFIDQT